METTTKLPACIVALHEINNRHWYEAVIKKTKEHFKWLTSVTHYTHNMPEDITGLLKYIGNLGYEASQIDMKEAGDIGTQVHKLEDRLCQREELRQEDHKALIWDHLCAY